MLTEDINKAMSRSELTKGNVLVSFVYLITNVHKNIMSLTVKRFFFIKSNLEPIYFFINRELYRHSHT